MHHMGPFVALVRENPQGHSEDEHPVVGLGGEGGGGHVEGEADHEGDGVGGVEAGLGEAVEGDILGIEVMHPEGADDRWAKDGGFKLSPSVCRPVAHSRYEIYEELGDDEAEDYWQWIGVIFDGLLDEQVPYA